MGGRKILSENFKKGLTIPHVCGKIIMLFLRQQVLESSVRLCRLPRNVRKVALCLFLGQVRERGFFRCSPAFDISF